MTGIERIHDLCQDIYASSLACGSVAKMADGEDDYLKATPDDIT